MARPCFHCLQMMKSVNIRYCYYSTYQNIIVRERVSSMISLQMSNNTKRLIDKIYTPVSCSVLEQHKLLHYEELMKSGFPHTVDKKTLDNFIQYNFILLFPNNYSYIIRGNVVYFFNSGGRLIVSSIINK